MEEVEEKAFAFAAEKAGLNISRAHYGWSKSRTSKGMVARAMRTWIANGCEATSDESKWPEEFRGWTASAPTTPPKQYELKAANL